MKKLLTVAAVASVALSSDFLAQHRPVALIKDGLNIVKDGHQIVKDVKSHNVGKLIKDGVKLHKDLKFEDQEFFVPTTPQEQLKLARELVTKTEILVKQYEAGLPLVKQMRPEMYDEFVVEYYQQKENLVFMRQSLELLEMLLGSDASSRVLSAEDNEFFAQNEVEDQLREMRAMLLVADAALKEMEDVLPILKAGAPEMYERMFAEYAYQKEQLAKARRDLEAVEAMLKGQFQATTGPVIKFQPMRKLFALDNELFFGMNDDLEAVVTEMKAQIAIFEAIIKDTEEVQLPMIKIMFPDQYQLALERFIAEKANLAEAKKEIEMLEAQLRLQGGRKLKAADNELFGMNDDLEAVLTEMKAQIAIFEAVIKETEAQLPMIKMMFPDQYNLCLERLNAEKANLAEAKKEIEMLEAQLRFQPARRLFAEDNEFYAINDAEAQLNEIKAQVIIFEAQLKQAEEVDLPMIKLLFPDMYELSCQRLAAEKQNLEQLKKYVEILEAQVKIPVPSRRLQAADNDFYAIDDAREQIKMLKEQVPLFEAQLKYFEEVELPAVKIMFPEMYELSVMKLAAEKQNLIELKKYIEIAEAQFDVVIPPRRLQADDEELFTLGELLKEGKKIRDELKHH